MNKTTTALIFIALGLAYLGMIKVAIITGLATILTIYTGKKQEKTGSTSPSNSEVKVQPIKVKRKWEEDVDPIYPDSMKINMDPAKTGIKDDLGDSLEGLGKIIGNVAKGVKDED